MGKRGVGSELSELFELLQTGTITQEEFEQAKAILLTSGSQSGGTDQARSGRSAHFELKQSSAGLPIIAAFFQVKQPDFEQLLAHRLSSLSSGSRLDAIESDGLRIEWHWKPGEASVEAKSSIGFGDEILHRWAGQGSVPGGPVSLQYRFDGSTVASMADLVADVLDERSLGLADFRWATGTTGELRPKLDKISVGLKVVSEGHKTPLVEKHIGSVLERIVRDRRNKLRPAFLTGDSATGLSVTRLESSPLVLVLVSRRCPEFAARLGDTWPVFGAYEAVSDGALLLDCGEREPVQYALNFLRRAKEAFPADFDLAYLVDFARFIRRVPYREVFANRNPLAKEYRLPG